jgi:hypothetical protein
VSKTAISISTNVLAAIVKWSCQDRDRLHLCTVLFEKGRAIATDGHRLVALPIPTNGHRLLVDSQHLSAAVAAQRDMKIDRPRSIGIEPGERGTILTIDNGVTMTVPSRDPAGYPPWEKVIPKAGGATKSPNGYILDPRYLAAIAEVNSAIVPNSNRGVRVVAWGPVNEDGDSLDAMLFEGNDDVQFVVMPMRCV